MNVIKIEIKSIGVTKFQLGNYDEAINYFKEAIDLYYENDSY